MAPAGTRKGWAVSGERLAFYTTKKLGVKVKSAKVEILVLLTRAGDKTLSDNASPLVHTAPVAALQVPEHANPHADHGR